MQIGKKHLSNNFLIFITYQKVIMQERI